MFSPAVFITRNSKTGSPRLAFAPRPVISAVTLTNESVVFSGTNGIANSPYFVLTSTNVTQPLAQWERIATNVFGSSGALVFSHAASLPPRFYALQLP